MKCHLSLQALQDFDSTLASALPRDATATDPDDESSDDWPRFRSLSTPASPAQPKSDTEPEDGLNNEWLCVYMDMFTEGIVHIFDLN